METLVLPVNVQNIGDFTFQEPEKGFLGDWDIKLSQGTHDADNLLQAVKRLQTSALPVAFPTETVYGLGADATRGDAVAGIYTAKRRPTDNPLIVHISSLTQLRQLLTSSLGSQSAPPINCDEDPIPSIYHSLISRFWPGPLTILLPLPKPSPLAPSVTGILPAFGARMPSSRLALALIHLAGVPIAAPSANASSRPSPTTAAHVLHDLSGRIELILDGGSCDVGVESTVVDGLANPPVILRPGGISIEMLRQSPGWEHVEVGYRDGTETSVPRAPGMKYKHYSPTARVILVHGPLSMQFLSRHVGDESKVGIATSKTWRVEDLLASGTTSQRLSHDVGGRFHRVMIQKRSLDLVCHESDSHSLVQDPLIAYGNADPGYESHAQPIQVLSTDLGTKPTTIAQNLFSALREMDSQGVGVIFVEAIDVTEGHEAAAVLNRLRKAAELEIEAFN